MFDSVLVVSDRNVIDTQLQEAIFSRKPASDNVPRPFHVYSMRQAIEEGSQSVWISASSKKVGEGSSLPTRDHCPSIGRGIADR